MSDFVFDPTTPEFRANPYPIYAKLREQKRVFAYNQQIPYIVSHWEDSESLLKDARFGRGIMDDMSPDERDAYMQRWPEGVRPLVEVQADWLLFKDPPNHTRLRGLVNKAFTPRIIENLRPRIIAIANDLLDDVKSDNMMDIIKGFAVPLPVIVIAEMLGVPPDDRRKFIHWSREMFAINDIVNLTMAEFERAGNACVLMSGYFENLIDNKRKNPADDLLSSLIAVEETGDTLSHKELIATSILLLTAGYETTLNLIGNGVLALLQHPKQLDLLKSKPDLMKNAVEELLRYNGPVHITSRKARQDLTLHGTHIKDGQTVAIFLASANHDPARFSNPDTLDISRNEGSPLSFGHGIHYCLGAPLARMETAIALDVLFQRMPNLQLLDDTPDWSEKVAFRGLSTLNVTF